MRRAVQFAYLSMWSLLAALPVSAQCVMCYKTAEGAGARTIAFLKLGIITMIIPTFFVLGALALMVYRRRKRDRDDAARGNFSDSSLPSLPIPPQAPLR